jgi:hypothetical protein
MKVYGIPFVKYSTESEDNEKAKGFRASLLYDLHQGDYKGILAAGLFAGTAGSGKSDGKLEGLCLSGLLCGAAKAKGAIISGISTIVNGDLEGVAISGISNTIEGNLNGFCYGIAYNRAYHNGKVSVQIGVANKIDKYNEAGIIIQLGLYNRAGEQTIPLINIRGLSRLLRKCKNNSPLQKE